MRSKALAHISLNSNTEFLNVIFYHPVIKDNKNPKKKRRIRRSLATKDIKEASKLISQLNELILGEEWHNIAMRERSKETYGELVTSIFYDYMEDTSLGIIREVTEKLHTLEGVNQELLDSVLSSLEKLKEDITEKILT